MSRLPPCWSSDRPEPRRSLAHSSDSPTLGSWGLWLFARRYLPAAARQTERSLETGGSRKPWPSASLPSQAVVSALGRPFGHPARRDPSGSGTRTLGGARRPPPLPLSRRDDRSPGL